MERLGGTLTSLLLTPTGAHYGAGMALRLSLLADVAGGLAYLHARDVIHVDVKPDNVLLTAVSARSPLPTAKLADFGSSLRRRDSSLTRDSFLGERGTWVYMDPCLYDGESIRKASDVYSFSVLAWHVLTGLVPFAAELAEVGLTDLQWRAKLQRHVIGGGRPPVAALVDRGVPPDVVGLVESCWAPAQEERPTMEHVYSTLVAAVAALAPWDGGDVALPRAPTMAAIVAARAEGAAEATAAAAAHAALVKATHDAEMANLTASLEGMKTATAEVQARLASTKTELAATKTELLDTKKKLADAATAPGAVSAAELAIMRSLLMRSGGTKGACPTFWSLQEWLREVSVVLQTVGPGSLGALLDEPSGTNVLADALAFILPDRRVNVPLFAIALNRLTQHAIAAGVEAAATHRRNFAAGFVPRHEAGGGGGGGGGGGTASSKSVGKPPHCTVDDVLRTPVFNMAWRLLLEPNFFKKALNTEDAGYMAMGAWIDALPLLGVNMAKVPPSVFSDVACRYAERVAQLAAWWLVAPATETGTPRRITALAYRYSGDRMRVSELKAPSGMRLLHRDAAGVVPVGPLLMPRDADAGAYGDVTGDPRFLLDPASYAPYADLADFKMCVLDLQKLE